MTAVERERPLVILVVTGASGAGKTSAVQALESRFIFGVRCFYFDSIGVPPVDEMIRDHGSPEQWQAAMTADWLARLRDLPAQLQLAILDGQTRPNVVFEAALWAAPASVNVALFDCAAHVRNERLVRRGQPELANADMDQWAAYLRGQADALSLPVIDTTTLSVEEATDQLEKLARRFLP